jgi:hypothetical protein
MHNTTPNFSALETVSLDLLVQVSGGCHKRRCCSPCPPPPPAEPVPPQPAAAQALPQMPQPLQQQPMQPMGGDSITTSIVINGQPMGGQPQMAA